MFICELIRISSFISNTKMSGLSCKCSDCPRLTGLSVQNKHFDHRNEKLWFSVFILNDIECMLRIVQTYYTVCIPGYHPIPALFLSHNKSLLAYCVGSVCTAVLAKGFPAVAPSLG